MSSHSDRTTRPRIPIKAPRGLELSCNGWQQEAALRMLMNSVDEEAAETPTSGGVDHDTLCVVGDWQSFDDIVRSLRTLENDETLLVHGDKIADIFPTHACAPRVIVCQETACDEAQAHAPAGEKSSEPEPSPIMAYRERIATSWLRIGSQELVQLLFENFSEVGEQHFGAGKGSASVEPSEPGCELAGKLIVSGGMGRLSGAQPLAATLAGAAFLGIDVDPECIKRRMKSGACDFMVNSLEEALRILKNAVRKRENISVGLVGNCAAVIPELAERGVVPDILTDFTPAHDPRRYVPDGMSLAGAIELRARDMQAYEQRAREAIARQVEAMLRLQTMGSAVFDFGNDMRAIAFQNGVKRAYEIPGVERYCRALLERGGPLSCVALSGARADISAIDELALQTFPQNKRLRRWIESARQRIRFEGLPARICWLGYGEQAQFAVGVNRLVAEGKIKAPVALLQHHCPCAPAPLPTASGATTERDAIRRGSPLLNALLNTASGATLVSVHIARKELAFAQQMIAADGSDAAGRRIEGVLTHASRSA